MNQEIQKNRPILICDGDNLIYRAYYKFTNLTNHKREPTGIIFGFPYVLRKAISTFHPKEVYCVFDSRSSEIRRKALPTYRVREKKLGFDAEGFQNQKEVIINFIRLFNCYSIKEEGYEADDIIYWLTRKFREQKIVILSADKDFNPLVSENLSIFNPFKDLHITTDNFQSTFGMTPAQYLDYLILDGDKSDKIPGYPGMGDKRIRDFLNQWGSIKDYLVDKNSSSYKKLDKTKLEATYNLNRLLINLKYYNLKYMQHFTPTINKPKEDKIEFRKICTRYDLNKFQEPQFLMPFTNLNK